MKLLIDIGNSRIKWAYLTQQQLHNPQAITHKDLVQRRLRVGVLLGKQQPEQVYIANVAGRDIGDRIAMAISNKWKLSPVFAEVKKSSHGVTNAYREITQLGIDRWLAVIAAWNRYQSAVCIVNCGTAVTIDGVSQTGRHLGGLIIPGLNLMQDRLNKATNGIKVESGERLELKFGRATMACVNNGAARAIVALVENVIDEMSQKYGRRLARIITGGDGERIKTLFGKKFDYDPHLVLHGLALLAGPSK